MNSSWRLWTVLAMLTFGATSAGVASYLTDDSGPNPATLERDLETLRDLHAEASQSLESSLARQIRLQVEAGQRRDAAEACKQYLRDTNLTAHRAEVRRLYRSEGLYAVAPFHIALFAVTITDPVWATLNTRSRFSVRVETLVPPEIPGPGAAPAWLTALETLTVRPLLVPSRDALAISGFAYPDDYRDHAVPVGGLRGPFRVTVEATPPRGEPLSLTAEIPAAAPDEPMHPLVRGCPVSAGDGTLEIDLDPVDPLPWGVDDAPSRGE